MLWCSKQYITDFNDIVHHKQLIQLLQHTKHKPNSLVHLQNTIFYGQKGCGKKTLVRLYVNHLLQTHFNVTPEQLILHSVNLKYNKGNSSKNTNQTKPQRFTFNKNK